MDKQNSAVRKYIAQRADLLGAIILKWMHENFVRIEQREKNKIFKKEDT